MSRGFDTVETASAADRDLVERHFAMQAERPADLRGIEIGALDPFLRSLLFSDGTVTRAISVQMLLPVRVEVIDQERLPLPAAAASCLEADAGLDSLQRRVRIGVGSAVAPVLSAESHIVPGRLPPAFLRLLDGAPDGIGESLQQMRLESWRELLWFGLGEAPEWAPGAGAEVAADVLTRLYRVTTGGFPAMLISENFAVERRGDTYSLPVSR